MKRMLFSIVVPVYNVENYLDRCVDSLINQTFRDIEILLVDDGSTDRSSWMCDQFAESDSRIRVIHKVNGGLSDARNAGVSCAHGSYIIFVDSDDWIELDTCEKFSAFIAEHPNGDMFIGVLRNEDGSLYSKRNTEALGKEYSGEDYFLKFTNLIKVCAVTNVYKREYLLNQKLQFPVGLLHEDVYFSRRAYIEAECVVYTDIVFYVRFIRTDSITQKVDKRRNIRDLLIICYRLLDYSYGLTNKKLRKCFQNKICDSYLSLFFEADIFQFKRINYDDYVDRKLVLMTAKTEYNIIRAILFTVSPRTYIFINKISKKISGT